MAIEATRTESEKRRRNKAKYERRKNDQKWIEKQKERKALKRKVDQGWRQRQNQMREANRKVDSEQKQQKNSRKFAKRKCDEKAKNAQRKRNMARHEVKNVESYEISIKAGHSWICVCCGQLFAKIGMATNTVIAEQQMKDIVSLKEVHYLKHIGKLQLCHTCNNSIKSGKVPKLWLGNGLDFPSIPDELRSLTRLEERMVSPRIPFMHVTELRPTTQLGIKGNIVNVPVEIDDSVKVLPRNFNELETIQLNLKRRLRYKTSFLKEMITPYRVFRAAAYLIQQPLYKEEGISLSNDFLLDHPNVEEEFIVDKNDLEEINAEGPVEKDNWDESDGKNILNVEDQQTLLKQAISFAPGEGRLPLAVLSDKFIEELSFPTIYCGQKRNLKVKLSYADIAKSEIRRYDRRCCDPVKLFFMFRKKEMTALNSAIQIYLKMTSQKDLSVEQVLDEKFIEDLVRHDDAYRVLSDDRTSPVYWQVKKRELMAMIRTLGIPTFFLTLSAAETRWPELIVILVKVLENRDITEEEANSMTWQYKCNLIRKDPVTCARYFDRRTRELFKLIRSFKGPFGEYQVEEFYIRIEFQHRGSPHVHSVIWLKNAPIYQKDNNATREECQDFIDKFVTCSRTTEDLKDYYGLQTHKHTSTCRKILEDKSVCRFGIPYFPMRETLILEPLEDVDMSDEELEEFPTILKNIQDHLNLISNRLCKDEMSPDIPHDFDEFLNVLDIGYETYVRVVRYTLKRAKIFLRRSPKDVRVNGFNEEILRRHRANMDIQFILDPYACVHYILDYINKSNRGMSRLLKEVVEELKTGNLSHRQKLYHVASKFINSSEVSAQEAVYILLSMPLSSSSRSTVFINTGRKDERVRRLKSKKELAELETESQEILVNGLIDHYIVRPDELEHLCLADFASKYDYAKTKVNKSIDETNDQLQDASEHSGKSLMLKNGQGYLRERKISKIIRYRRYQEDKEPKEFYREKLMLFKPWRNEEYELMNINHENVYLESRQMILKKEREFINMGHDDIDKIESELVEKAIKERAEDSDPNLEEDETLENEFTHLNLRKYKRNFEEEKGQSSDGSRKVSGNFLLPKVLKDSAFDSLIAKLNDEQSYFLHTLIHHVKTTDKPFHYFLSGGAGSGKSVTIEAIYQSLIRWYLKHPECSGKPDLPTVLLLAPTGKSAFHIGGTTLHSAFSLQVTQNKNELKPLCADKKNELRNKLWNLKVLIIDEVSMVGASTLQNVHKRLVEIYETNDSFGGRSVLFVGDFNQLRPVKDSYVFSQTKGNDLSVIAGPVLWHDVKYFRLNQIMRQKNDHRFANALNRLANGCLMDEDKEMFTSRLFAKTSPILPVSAVRLFRINEMVDRYNASIIEREDGQEVIEVNAFDHCNNSMKRVRDQALFIVGNMNSRQTQGLSKVLSLKLNVRYMISINVDIADGLVNGSDGILRKIETVEIDGQTQVKRVWMEFGCDQIGLKARSFLKKVSLGDSALTPIDRVSRDITTKSGTSLIKVTRTQFPLVISEAISIHKSQGQSYDQVVVDVSSLGDTALMYTAFSRARSLNGLFLIGKEIRYPSPRPNAHPVSIEMRRLQNEAKLVSSLPYLPRIQDCNSLKIGYQNVPYLLQHKDVIEKNYNLKRCDILFFVETHSSNVVIDGFKLIQESCQNYGIAIYARNSRNNFASVENFYHRTGPSSHIEIAKIVIQSTMSILLIYISPKFPKQEAIHEISKLIAELPYDHDRVIIGDFNIQFISKDFERLKLEMRSHGLNHGTPESENSTDYRTQIDFVFTNLQASIRYDESVISDHKPIIMLVDSSEVHQ